jgi:septal ring factor EnvC (AmiA/AmiB activator)
MPSKVAIICISLLFGVLPFGTLPHAKAKGSSAKNVSITIGKLKEGIKQHQDKVLQSADQEMTVLEELQMLDQNLKKQLQKITKLKQALAQQEQLLARKDKELQAAETERNKVLEHLQKRLRAFYMMGETGILNVTFSNKDLPELMLFTDAFEQLVTYDQSVIDQYRKTVNTLQRAKHAQELENALLQEFIRQAQEGKQTLDQLVADKQSLMKRIKMQQGLYKRALKEMHKEEAALSKTLAKIKRNAEIKKRAFQNNKGKLPKPVKGRLVLSFGEVIKDGLFKGEISRGITIATARGAAVHAVFKGKVAFAGYKKGYGNTIVIDHGFKYFTVTSHLDTIVVEAGDRVKKGSLIGSTGDMATLFTKGLYFEVRIGSKQKDPLKWLKHGSY